jgi:hypothetical protein
MLVPNGGGATSYNNIGHWPIFEDVVVANNLIADQGGTHAFIQFQNQTDAQHCTFIDCYVCNNIGVNGGYYNFDPDVVAANNVKLTSAEAASVFAAYANMDEGNDFHLAAAATDLIGQGTDLSSYFTADAEGNLRAAAWDIGPYIYRTPPSAVAPSITLQPLRQSATLGADVLLTITASGVPTPTLQWQKDGVDIDGATGATLVLSGVQPSDAGTYTCIATNSEGSATSGAAILSVNMPVTGIYRFAGLGFNPMLLLP